MRPSSSASIACIASPVWSGFNRFYQYLRFENADPGKPSAQKERPGTKPGLIANSKSLAMMMAVMTTMMTGRGVGRNHRPGQNDERDGSNKQCAQLHVELPLNQSLSSGLSCYLQRIPPTNFSH